MDYQASPKADSPTSTLSEEEKMMSAAEGSGDDEEGLPFQSEGSGDEEEEQGSPCQPGGSGDEEEGSPIQPETTMETATVPQPTRTSGHSHTSQELSELSTTSSSRSSPFHSSNRSDHIRASNPLIEEKLRIRERRISCEHAARVDRDRQEEDDTTDNTATDLDMTLFSTDHQEAIEAVAVDERTEEEKVKKAAKKYLEKDAVVATATEPDPVHPSRVMMIGGAVLGILLVVGILTGVLVSSKRKTREEPSGTTTLRNNSLAERRSVIQNILLESSADGPILPSNTTTTTNATDIFAEQVLTWMTTEDNWLLDQELPLEEYRVVQRFALLNIFERPSSDNFPPQGANECDWYPEIVVCHLNKVTRFELTKREIPRLGNQIDDDASIPSWLGLLTDLTNLDLSESQFEGTVPSSLRHLTAIEELVLKDNALTGPVPLPLFSNMSRLSFLDLDSNEFSGTLPHDMGPWWPQLNVFKIIANRGIHGTLPSTIANWNFLTWLLVGKTGLQGTLPSGLDSLVQLEDFYLAYCNFSGPVPEYITTWSSLEFFDISGNDFTGTLPEGIKDLPLLDTVWLDDTRLHGHVSLCDRTEWHDDGNKLLLVADCMEVNCTCCDMCCPVAYNGIPQYRGCLG